MDTTDYIDCSGTQDVSSQPLSLQELVLQESRLPKLLPLLGTHALFTKVAQPGMLSSITLQLICFCCLQGYDGQLQAAEQTWYFPPSFWLTG